MPIRVPDDFLVANLFEIKDRLEPVCPGNEVYGAFIRRKRSVLDGPVGRKREEGEGEGEGDGDGDGEGEGEGEGEDALDSWP